MGGKPLREGVVMSHDLPDEIRAKADADRYSACGDVLWPINSSASAEPAQNLRYKGTIRTDAQGSEVAFDFEVEGGATQEQIEEIARHAVLERVRWHYKPV